MTIATEAWNAIWEFAEYVYGVEDIRSDPIFMAAIARTGAKSLHGTSEGWLWDASKGRLVPDPDHVRQSEADDDGWCHDGGDGWSVTIEVEGDTGDGGRDL